MGTHIKPQRIVTETNTENSAVLLENGLSQAVFNKKNCAVIKEGGYILLDFGKEINGGIAVTTQDVSNGAKYRIVFGESVMEALSDLGEKNSGNYHSVRDMTVDAVFMSTQRFGDTGFRFAKIEAIGGDITVRTAAAIPEIRDVEYKGSFKCNDELLNEIWNTGAYTVQLNMHDYLWDGVKRDRLVWIGDMHPETSTIKAVFGQDECVKRSLDLIKNETPEGEWMNGMPTYSMWWIIIHYDWFMHWGDIDYLKQQKEYMIKLANQITKWIDDDFVALNLNYRFSDWSSMEQKGEIEGIKSISCIALRRLTQIMDILGETALLEKCRDYCKCLESEKTDDKNEPNNRLSALTVLAKRCSEQSLKTVLETTEYEMSCFMGYYILLALSERGEYSKSLNLIRKYWGEMLRLGATSFWEEFKMEWAKNAGRIDEIVPEGKSDIHGDFGEHCYKQYRLSLCHGWASGPTAFLSEQIGGIEILEPGCKKLKISPNLGDLEWIEIEYPTPYGKVKVYSCKENGETKTTITSPGEIEIVKV